MNAAISDETLADREPGAPERRSVTAPQLFVALECARPMAGSARHSLLNIDEVVIGRGPVRSCERRVEEGVRRLRLQLPDARVSSRHARVFRGGDGWQLQDLGSRNGCRVDGAPATAARLRDGALIEVGHTFLRFAACVPTFADTPGDCEAAELAPGHTGLATLWPELSRAFDTLKRIAASKVPVLLLGETGSGKELLARTVHAESGRAGELVAVNCGAIPQSLLEAQLFGHMKGAFSGANRDELGYVRAADRGTLFLDEIGELPASSQAALLRVLQEGEVIPVGSTRPVAVDIRVVAATHAPIDELVAAGSFRDDLLARLSGFRFVAPPLRERIDDLGLLIASILGELPLRGGSPWSIEPEGARALLNHDWPHNIRELKQCLTAAAVLGGRDSIAHADLPATIVSPRAPRAAPNRGAARTATKDELREQLHALFAECQGNVSEVARRMGKARVQVQRWMKRFAIDPASFRGQPSRAEAGSGEATRADAREA